MQMKLCMCGLMIMEIFVYLLERWGWFEIGKILCIVKEVVDCGWVWLEVVGLFGYFFFDRNN